MARSVPEALEAVRSGDADAALVPLVASLAPWGVDVATGVEAAPGRKDPTRVAAFIRNARDTFAQFKEKLPRRASRR